VDGPSGAGVPGGTAVGPALAAAGPESTSDPWGQLWAIWMQAAAPEKKSAPHPYEELMRAFMAPPEAPPAQAPAAAPWAEMMEKGRDVQMQYLASLQSIFEEASKPPEK
jgi:hypothetical protein